MNIICIFNKYDDLSYLKGAEEKKSSLVAGHHPLNILSFSFWLIELERLQPKWRDNRWKTFFAQFFNWNIHRLTGQRALPSPRPCFFHQSPRCLCAPKFFRSTRKSRKACTKRSAVSQILSFPRRRMFGGFFFFCIDYRIVLYSTPRKPEKKRRRWGVERRRRSVVWMTGRRRCRQSVERDRL